MIDILNQKITTNTDSNLNESCYNYKNSKLTFNLEEFYHLNEDGNIELNFDYNIIDFEKELNKKNSPLRKMFLKSLEEKNKEEITKIAKKIYKKSTELIDVLKKVRKDVNDKFDIKGLWNCYIGYDLLLYKKGDIVLESCLLFKPCRIYIDNRYISIEIENKEVINEKLVGEIYKINNVNLDKDLPSNPKEIIEKIKKDIEGIEFEIKDEKLIGIFEPQISKFSKEIQYIANLDEDLYKSNAKRNILEYSKDEFSKEPLLIINKPLNFYQKIACRSALEENTIIFGPPGTGKSEIIVNIIANAIVNEKNVLVVSEKRTALEVLMNRLKDVNDLALYLIDFKNEKSVYYKINKIQERIGNFWESNLNEHSKINLKNEIYNVNSIEAFSERTSAFYEKIKNKVNSELKITNMDKNASHDKYEIDYKNYLQIKNSVTSKIEDDFLKVLNQYKEKMLHHDESIFILLERIINYNNFYKKFVIKPSEANQYFNLLEEFNKVKSWSLFYDRDSGSESFYDRYRKFYNFMINIDLDKDKKFKDFLLADHTVFEQQIKVIESLFEKYPDVMSNKTFFKFLINKKSTHQAFIKSLARTQKAYRYLAIDAYLTTGKIKRTGNLFKNSKLNKEELLMKKECIAEFSNLILPANSSSLFLNFFSEGYSNKEALYNKDVWKYFTCDLVYFYLNSDIKKEEIKYMIDHKLMHIPDELMKKYELSNIYLEEENIKKIAWFEKHRFELIQNLDKTFDEEINEYFTKNSESCEFISNEIYTKYVDYLRNFLINSPEEFKNLAKEMFQVARVPNNMKLTTFLNRYHDVLKKVLPIWVALPDQVSLYCKFERNIFDIAIMDEASQMLMQNALPILYRVKHSVASGDDKQLRPMSFFQVKSSVSNIRIDNLEKIDFNIVDSLLDRASVALWNCFTLKNHYRSNKQELIKFSNDEFYNKSLVFASLNNNNDKSIEVINTNGTFDGGKNKKEAIEVVRQLEKAIKIYESILVIAFSEKQIDAIDEEMKKSKQYNTIQNLIDRNIIKIRSLENSQGEEADCVILSISYGKAKDGKLKNQFGFLSRSGGMNRLNVAITRSKIKMIVIKSLKASQMSINHDNLDARAFFDYIGYLDSMEKYYESINNVSAKGKPNYLYGEEILEAIKPFISKNKIDYTCNYMVGSKKIDIVLYTKNLNNINLLILLDNWSKYDEFDELLSDINDQEFLVTRKYKFIRVREIEWIQNKELVIEYIKQVMEW